MAPPLARLMRDNGMQARQRRRFKRTTDSDHHWPVARNVIDQDFAATGPDEKWGVDISYIWTHEGWLYLAPVFFGVIDLFPRRVVGWATGDRLHRNLALAALRKAIIIRYPPEGLLHHSDRGSQYCPIDYQAELRQHGIVISMSGKGNCFDNPMVETFFKTLKIEMIGRTKFNTRADAHAAFVQYIDGFYNPIRRHSALDYLSPVHFEKRAANRDTVSPLYRSKSTARDRNDLLYSQPPIDRIQSNCPTTSAGVSLRRLAGLLAHLRCYKRFRVRPMPHLAHRRVPFQSTALPFPEQRPPITARPQ